MTFKLNTNNINNIYLNNLSVDKLYLGVNLFYNNCCLLDGYTDLAYAFGLERLINTYTGSCIRVTRTSDSQEQDIGFIGNALDISALEAFCTGTNGLILKWYDQSGNDFYLETSATYEPIIVKNGSVVVDSNNKVSAEFLNKAMQKTLSGLQNNDYAVFMEISSVDGDTESIPFSHGFNIGNNKGILYKALANNTFQVYWGGAGYGTGGLWVDNTNYKFTLNVNNEKSFKFYNNTTLLHNYWRAGQDLNDQKIKIGTMWGNSNANCSMLVKRLICINHFLTDVERLVLINF